MSHADICYHHSDADGFCAAAIVNAPENVRLGYNTKITNSDLLNACSGRKVAMVDFSLPVHQMKMIKEMASEFIWIDHHESAAPCSELGLEGLFSMKKAGCALTWDFFNPESPYPDSVKYVGDRDIWKFEYPETKDYCYGLNVTKGMDDPSSALWKKLISGNDFTKPLIDAGEIVSRVVNEDIVWTKRLNLFRDGRIFIINATSNVSELASDILDQFGKEALVIVWQFAKKGLRFSFRGKGAKEMAEGFAAEYGTRGGGHPLAAGCSIPADHPKMWEALKTMTDLAHPA